MITWTFNRKYRGWSIYKYADPQDNRLAWRAQAEQKNIKHHIFTTITILAPSLARLKEEIKLYG